MKNNLEKLFLHMPLVSNFESLADKPLMLQRFLFFIGTEVYCTKLLEMLEIDVEFKFVFGQGYKGAKFSWARMIFHEKKSYFFASEERSVKSIRISSRSGTSI